jgi:hypothetical protein
MDSSTARARPDTACEFGCPTRQLDFATNRSQKTTYCNSMIRDIGVIITLLESKRYSSILDDQNRDGTANKNDSLRLLSGKELGRDSLDSEA